ncbi:MAG TPA: glycogen synthase [Gammaproteobacteria bacterium]
MRILTVCAEFAPWAKTGGLADAVAGLCDALCAAGHDVRVLLPRYAHLAPPRGPRHVVDGLGGPFLLGELEPEPEADAARPRRTTPRVFLLELGDLVADTIYTGDARDAGRFLRLASAAVAASTAADWRPDLLHCHDWHAALAPVLQRLAPQSRAPSVLTLHNVGYQGVFADSVLEEHGFAALRSVLPADPHASGTISFLRAGLLAADRVTTVSPTYAEEIRRPEFGMGLEDVLAARGNDLVGILNGVDYSVWSPDHDPFLVQRYDATDLRPKRHIKQTLLERLRLAPAADAPLVGVVSRLVEQKGIDLLTAALPTLIADTPAAFALLGSGDAVLAAELRRLSAAHPTRLSFTEGYDEKLAHEILAGSDLTVVPSRYEPCGLTQMYALRYGTIPVVRSTGGLADTIRHFDTATGLGNGSVFRDADPQGVLWGVRTALQWFADAAVWPRLVRNAMAADFSWRSQVPHYEELYRSLL